jgi:hypothetical protein
MTAPALVTSPVLRIICAPFKAGAPRVLWALLRCGHRVRVATEDALPAVAACPWCGWAAVLLGRRRMTH